MHIASVAAAVKVNALSLKSRRSPTRKSPMFALDEARPHAVHGFCDYSVRRASDGWTREARQAGMRLARAETTSSTTAAAVHDTRSVAPTPYNALLSCCAA